MADGIDDIRRDIVILPTQEKAIIARDVLRSLGPEDRENITSEFAESPELRQDRLREARQERQTNNRMMIGFVVFVFTIALLAAIVLAAPEHLEVLLPVITSILGTVVGFLFGQQGSSRSG